MNSVVWYMPLLHFGVKYNLSSIDTFNPEVAKYINRLTYKLQNDFKLNRVCYEQNSQNEIIGTT